MSDTSNTSATQASRMRHECDTSETETRRVRYEYNTNATRTIRVRRECYTNDTSVTRVKNFDFDNDTSKNIFSHTYIYYMASERLQGEEQFYSKNLLEVAMSKCVGKSTTKTELCNFRSYINKYTQDCSCKCPCTFPHSYT